MGSLKCLSSFPVPNWLPSLSAAVSTFAPERYIWRLFIGLHGTPRFQFSPPPSIFMLLSFPSDWSLRSPSSDRFCSSASECSIFFLLQKLSGHFQPLAFPLSSMVSLGFPIRLFVEFGRNSVTDFALVGFFNGRPL